MVSHGGSQTGVPVFEDSRALGNVVRSYWLSVRIRATVELVRFPSDDCILRGETQKLQNRAESLRWYIEEFEKLQKIKKEAKRKPRISERKLKKLKECSQLTPDTANL
jgi:hypothetical protein